MKLLHLLMVGVAALAGSAPTQAHFLFAHVGPTAEGGRFVEVYFSERAEAGDPRFVEKIAHTQLWLQATPGKFEPLKARAAADRLRARVPSDGSLAVVGSCQYGVLARPGETAFLLRHYPKAVAGSPEDLNKLKPCDKVPLEIVAHFDGDKIQLTALRDGKPLPKAEFHTVAADLTNETLGADDEGRAVWKPAAPGRYSVYVRSTVPGAGKVDEKGYEETREFATLAFSWPLQRTGADAEAVALFEEALAARLQWKQFPGFTADISGTVSGRGFSGKATVDASGSAKVEVEDATVRPWVEEQLESIAMHRGAGAETTGERKKPVLRFAEPKDDHPLGRLLIFEGGHFASSYRVKDRQLTVVNRNLGKQDMTITVLENNKNAQGQFLPGTYTVQYWDVATGELRRSESVREQWERVDGWDLPGEHTVTSATDNGLEVRTLRLSHHQLLKAK